MKKLKELFTVTYGVNLELYKLTLSDGLDSINYVSRTKKNNGVSARVEKIANLTPNPANTLSIALTGSVLEVFLQEEEYYSGRDIAVAYELGCVTQFDSPRKLADYGLKVAPQSYVYIRSENVTG